MPSSLLHPPKSSKSGDGNRRRKSSSGGGGDGSGSLSFPGCGATLDPTAVFREITEGTSFEHDPRMQAHLSDFADAFLDVARTREGASMLRSLEGIGRAVKDRNGFVDSVKMMFRLAKRMGSNPMVQFGLFLGLIGTLTGLVAHFGPAGLVGAGLQLVLRRLYLMIFSCALSPLYKGITSSVSSFFGDASDKFLNQLDEIQEVKPTRQSK